VDADGVPVPNADPQIAFKVNGPGAIVAVDNADNASHESFHASERKAYQGWSFAIVRATGTGAITLTASARGLTGSSVAISGK
jgi:beta-galactosidase